MLKYAVKSSMITVEESSACSTCPGDNASISIPGFPSIQLWPVKALNFGDKVPQQASRRKMDLCIGEF